MKFEKKTVRHWNGRAANGRPRENEEEEEKKKAEKKPRTDRFEHEQ